MYFITKRQAAGVFPSIRVVQAACDRLLLFQCYRMIITMGTGSLAITLELFPFHFSGSLGFQFGMSHTKGQLLCATMSLGTGVWHIAHLKGCCLAQRSMCCNVLDTFWIVDFFSSSLLTFWIVFWMHSCHTKD